MFSTVASAHSPLAGPIDPWPFPWAKECPVNWDTLGGYYLLAKDTTTNGGVSLRISVISKDGLRLLRVSRYSNLGSWKYEGTTFVTENQKLVRLYLSPVNHKGDPIWAIIKLHYVSDIMECSADRLVPIMTLQASDNEEEYVDYKMEKVGN